MHVRIIRGKLKPGTWDAYERVFQTELCAAKIPGLKARWLMRDVGDENAGYSVSVWESEAAMRTYEADTATRERLFAAMKPFFTGEFQEHHCEMRVTRDFV